MKKCKKCGRELPENSKAVLCEHCKGEFADGAKKAVKTGAAAVVAAVALGGAVVKIITKK